MPENNFQPVCDADQIPAGQSKAFSIVMSRLVKKSMYDERVLESKFKTMQDNITP